MLYYTLTYYSLAQALVVQTSEELKQDATVTLMGEFDSIMVFMVLSAVVIVIIICNLKVITSSDLRLIKEEVRGEVS